MSPSMYTISRAIFGHSSQSSEESAGPTQSSDSVRGTSYQSLQDRFLTTLIQQIIPMEDGDPQGEGMASASAVTHVERPAFSLPLMTNNFRRFNARIGIFFVFQTRMERLLAWRRPAQTMSFLFTYSFICLNPHLIFIIPITTILFFVMVPAFVARHPPPPSNNSTLSTTHYYSYQGPALAPAKTIKPAPETSKDFFRNMRDLQNSMEDLSNIHDAMISAFSPFTNFGNESLSSTTFLLCVIITAVLFLTAHMLPWRWLFLICGNFAVMTKNPSVRNFLKNFHIGSTDTATLVPGAKIKESTSPNASVNVCGLSIPSTLPSTMSLIESLADISLDSDPEEREVEIFELQHRSFETYASSHWEHFLFSPQPYDPLSPARIAGDRPRGCRFFEDVQPPLGWTWKSKKWELDLECREWVLDRMFMGVGCEVPGGATDGIQDPGGSDEIGGWVWDLPPSYTSSSREKDAIMAALGYSDFVESAKSSTRLSSKSMCKGKRKSLPRDWEEENRELNKTGEWRRRRWVRIVQRTRMPSNKL